MSAFPAPIAAEYRPRVRTYREGRWQYLDQRIPVALLGVEDADAICMWPDGSIRRIELWTVHVLEDFDSAVRQAQLRAHVLVSQPIR